MQPPTPAQVRYLPLAHNWGVLLKRLVQSL